MSCVFCATTELSNLAVTCSVFVFFCSDHVTPCLRLPMSPGKCFAAWLVLCDLSSNLSRLMLNHLLLPTLLCLPATLYPKAKWNHSRVP